MSRLSVGLILLVGILACPAPAQEKITRSTRLTANSYSNIRDACLFHPPKELWSEIPWRPSLAEAIEEARKADKPILLWMMNGHPCGMT